MSHSGISMEDLNFAPYQEIIWKWFTWIVELPVLWVLAKAILVLGWQSLSLFSVFVILSTSLPFDLNKSNPKRNEATRTNFKRQALESVMLKVQLHNLTDQVLECTCAKRTTITRTRWSWSDRLLAHGIRAIVPEHYPLKYIGN